MVAGVLACGVTHAGMTPLDVTKCNMQVQDVTYAANEHTANSLCVS